MAKIVDLGKNAYGGFASLLNWLQSPLLLAIRLYWGLAVRTGRLGQAYPSRQSDGVLRQPWTCLRPAGRAHGCADRISGGVLFALGIASRLTSLVLFVNMTMAYLSVPDDRVNFSHIFPSPTTSMAPRPTPIGSQRC
jgi:putative oxidoreductase